MNSERLEVADFSNIKTENEAILKRFEAYLIIKSMLQESQ